jgi:transposase-like protein
MTKAITRDPIYRGRRFSAETIELCVRWYLTYRLSYRDLVAMLAECGTTVSHTTIMRWALRYVPEYEVRWARFARSPGSSWRMDETAVNVRGGRYYLYRAVDKHGKSVGSFLSNERSMEAAQDFFRECVARPGVSWPRKINIDGNSATLRALRLLSEEDAPVAGRRGKVAPISHNVVEQDHRAIKRRHRARRLGSPRHPARLREAPAGSATFPTPRFQDEHGVFQRTVSEERRTAPHLIELNALLAASRAVENHSETAADLAYLLGRGTSLGGLRPKCSRSISQKPRD